MKHLVILGAWLLNPSWEAVTLKSCPLAGNARKSGHD